MENLCFIKIHCPVEKIGLLCLIYDSLVYVFQIGVKEMYGAASDFINFSNGSREELLQKFICDRVFYVTIADAYIESCKVSLFDKHLDFMLQGKNLNI